MRAMGDSTRRVNEMAVERADAEAAVDTLVRYIEGADGALREGLVDTPGRVISAYDEIFSGYGVNVQKTLDSTFNSEGYDGIVLLRDIGFHSTCEHHMLTLSGRAHVAYIPVERIVGISKLARLVDIHARRLQNQERITRQVADALVEHLSPLGCAVIIEAGHGCMRCRGVQKSHAVMTTSAMRGVFLEKPEARSELMQLIRSKPLDG